MVVTSKSYQTKSLHLAFSFITITCISMPQLIVSKPEINMEVCRYTASIWSYVPSLENEKKTSKKKKNTPKIPVNIAISHKKGRGYLTYNYTLITSMAYIRFWYPHYCQKPDYKNLLAKMRRKEKSINQSILMHSSSLAKGLIPFTPLQVGANHKPFTSKCILYKGRKSYC